MPGAPYARYEMTGLRRLTLGQLFVLATLAFAIALGATFSVVLESSRRSIVERSDQLRDAAALRIGHRLSAELGVAASALDNVERAIRFGTLRVDDPLSAEAGLATELLDHPTLSDVTLTRATLLAHDSDQQAVLADGERWQTSVFRASSDPASEIVTRRIHEEGKGFACDMRHRPAGGGLLSGAFAREGPAPDPTSHLTFATSVSQPWYGQAIWSDLSRSELDANLPVDEQRVVVTVQKAVEQSPGQFVGVVRVGLLTQTIDALPSLDQAESQRVFLCDLGGRLVARLDPADRLEVVDDDLRVAPARAPPEIAAALESRGLRDLSPAHPEHSERLVVGGAAFLVTFRALENSQGWVAGVLVPEDYYTRDLLALRRRFFSALLAMTAALLVAGGLVTVALRRSLGRVVASTSRMRHFDFSASPADAPLREMAEVLDGVERAKTSMRALGKYVPIDLVRELYESNREPELGGELVEVSLLFSDIEGFTQLSERLSPSDLAQALGRYLDVMTRGVHSTQGTVDKFIGDSVMAFWNAPTRRADHAHRACRAVLECLQGTRDLYRSPAWVGLPPLFTRFGLHRAKVMVGHFGAPDRLSYTALGDGVNLASRIEGLCKQYGVAVLASQAIVDATSDECEFRLIDRVAVKGKTEAVRVYELLGLRGECGDSLSRARDYEGALEAYFARDFKGALALLAAGSDDPPSRVLAERCEAMLAHPPPGDWNGVYVATTK